MLSSHLLKFRWLFNLDHASQGKKTASFHFNFLFFPVSRPSITRPFSYTKKEKIRITWHKFLAFCRLILVFHDSFWMGNWHLSIVWYKNSMQKSDQETTTTIIIKWLKHRSMIWIESVSHTRQDVETEENGQWYFYLK